MLDGRSVGVLYADHRIKQGVFTRAIVPLLAAFGIRRFCFHSNLDESRRALRSGAWAVAGALVAMSAIVWFAHQFPLNARTQAQLPALGENTLWRAMFHAFKPVKAATASVTGLR